MKEGWRSFKMSDVFYLQMGKTPSRDNKAFWNGETAWVSISDMSNVKYISDTKEKITNEAIVATGIKEIPIHTVIMSFKLSVGKVAITARRLYTNEAIMAFIPKDEYDLLPAFIYYSLMGHHWEGHNRAVMGVTLNKTSISKSDYSFPSFSEQKRIVEELDLLSSIIEKQKQQLKELDILVQSIFYEMFGDPVTNEKDWQVIEFEKCIERIKYPKKLNTKEYLDSGRYPIVSQEESLISGYTDQEDCVFKVSRPIVVFGDHTRCFKYISFDFALGADGVKILLPMIQLNAKFFYYCMVLSRIPSLGYSRHYKLLKELLVILPPLDLQNLFASKIEAIEKQKEVITKSIEETQKLFDYTMDKYFG